MKLDESTLRAMSAIKAMRTVSEENGNSEMTLDDINAEIAKARKERKAKR
jgi:hypothetical protein